MEKIILFSVYVFIVAFGIGMMVACLIRLIHLVMELNMKLVLQWMRNQKDRRRQIRQLNHIIEKKMGFKIIEHFYDRDHSYGSSNIIEYYYGKS